MWITDALAGKEIKSDPKSITRAKQWEDRRSAARTASAAKANPATVLIQADAEKVKSTLISECASKGFAIISESEHQVTVAREVNAGFNLVGTLLIGPNATVKKYRANLQFIMTAEGDNIRVTSAAEVIAQDGYGRIASQNVTSDPQARTVLQGILDGLKAKVEGRND